MCYDLKGPLHSQFEQAYFLLIRKVGFEFIYLPLHSVYWFILFKPAEKFPGIFAPDSIFARYYYSSYLVCIMIFVFWHCDLIHKHIFCRFPYFLPCLMTSVFAAVVTVACFWIPVCPLRLICYSLPKCCFCQFYENVCSRLCPQECFQFISTHITSSVFFMISQVSTIKLMTVTYQKLWGVVWLAPWKLGTPFLRLHEIRWFHIYFFSMSLCFKIAPKEGGGLRPCLVYILCCVPHYVWIDNCRKPCTHTTQRK